MISFALSIYDSGLLIIAVILVVLYLIVLIKLNPSTEREKNSRPKSLKQNVHEVFSNEQRSSPVTPYENREEPEERVNVVERPGSTSMGSVETEEIKFSRNNQSLGCPHHFGYLKEHQKNAPIPNECLTCTKLMMCLARKE